MALLVILVHVLMLGLLIVSGAFLFDFVQALRGVDTMAVQGTTWIPEMEFRAPCGDRSFLEGELPAGRLPYPCPSGVDEAAWRPRAVEVVASVPITQVKAKLFFGGFTALQLGVLWAILISVRQFARAASHRRVFVAENARHLARIGALLVAIPLLATLGESLSDSALPDTATGIAQFNFQSGLQDNWMLLTLCGLIILTVSSAFRYGVQLQEFERAVV